MGGFERVSAADAGRPIKVQWAMDEHFSDLVVAFNAALRRLLRVPAPDLPALGLKVALIVDHDVAGLIGGERCMAVLKADALRLCSSSRE